VRFSLAIGGVIGLSLVTAGSASPLARPLSAQTKPMAGQSSPPPAADQKLGRADAAILNRIDDHYNHLRSLRTRYVERYDGMGMQRAESGTLLLKKPGRMRWSYDQPAGKLFVLDGKNAIFYTPGDAQAQRLPAKELDDLRSPLRFLLGHTQLRRELDGITVTPVSGGFQISGMPKGMGSRLKRLTIDVTLDGAITAMLIEEIDGSLTSFTFTDMQVNVPAGDANFTFTPPAGVIIVDGLPPV
jgi:outer membrane lipoprotein carrier protein